jgi:hypothetical protein
LLPGYWEATQTHAQGEPVDRLAWKDAVRKVATLARRQQGAAA